MIHYLINGLIIIIKIPLYILKGIITVLTIIPKYLITGIKFITEKKDPNKKEQKDLESKFVPTVIITLSLVTYLLSIFVLTRWYVQSERSKKFSNTLSEDILSPKLQEEIDMTGVYEDTPSQKNEVNTNTTNQINTNYINADLNYYQQINNETVAWLKVNNTNINYPVVKHKDNSYYLEHDFYKRKTINGWIFADYRDNFDEYNNNTIIYGHNLVNRTMFGQIPYMLRKTWFNNQNSQYIKLSSKKNNTIWQIFSVYKISPTTDYLQSKFNSLDEYEKFLKKVKNRSQQKFDVSLNYTDKIITLSTCDDIGTSRIAVHAKLIKLEQK